MSSRTFRVASLPLLLLTGIADAQQPPPNYGFDWVTVGAAGNRAALPSEVPLWTSSPVGAVNYDYRMMRDKLDVEHYLEFVNAYAPHWTGNPWDLALTGRFVTAREPSPGVWTYQVRPGCEHAAASIEWQMAARYCNWLQNGKANTSAAFENGVYDTSTFHLQNPGWSAQLTPSLGAQYWIPNLDEWVKAAYYDPNKSGPGLGGYWSEPNASDQPLVMGLPAQGGQTIGDLLWQTDPNRWEGAWPLGQYPQVQSPWGLIDISATVPDYTTTVSNQTLGTVWMGGSLAGDSGYYWNDQLLVLFSSGRLWGSSIGALRIASVVPEPCTVTSVVVFSFLGAQRRRRCVRSARLSRRPCS